MDIYLAVDVALGSAELPPPPRIEVEQIIQRRHQLSLCGAAGLDDQGANPFLALVAHLVELGSHIHAQPSIAVGPRARATPFFLLYDIPWAGLSLRGGVRASARYGAGRVSCSASQPTFGPTITSR